MKMYTSILLASFSTYVVAQSDDADMELQFLIKVYEDCTDKNSERCGRQPLTGQEQICNDDAYTILKEGFDSFHEKRYSRFCDEARASHCPPGGCRGSFSIHGIMQYGCWCNFRDNLMDGSGQPVNLYDSICKKFQLCLRCARWDGRQENYSCNPKTDTYNAIGRSDFRMDCSRANPGDLCGESLCSCNTSFLQRLFEQLWIVPSTYTDVFLHRRGFDQSQNCPLPPPVANDEMACCGYYPDRFPYGINSITKECCRDQTIYNPIIQDCCRNGSIADRGNC